MAAHGGIVRPYGSTFLQFADYMRGSVRLSALMGLPVAWVWTHDSVGLGEDGPTHQPVEHLAALRAIPELVVLRPGDANETADAWRVISRGPRGPGGAHPVAPGPAGPDARARPARASRRGAYVLRDAARTPAAVIVATGSEVWVALAAADSSATSASRARVVSMPCWELFGEQDDDYRDEVLPAELPTVSVEAGVSMGWERWVDAQRLDRALRRVRPRGAALEKLGITPDHVAEVARELLAVVQT